MRKDGTERASASRWFLDQCVCCGLTPTQQRREIYAILSVPGQHPDAETIYRRVRRRMPAISLDTVYRNLRALETHGIIRKVGSNGHRARYDANRRPHHHFICATCDRILDFYDERMQSYRPPPEVIALGAVLTWHIELRGVCSHCMPSEVPRKNLELRTDPDEI